MITEPYSLETMDLGVVHGEHIDNSNQAILNLVIHSLLKKQAGDTNSTNVACVLKDDGVASERIRESQASGMADVPAMGIAIASTTAGVTASLQVSGVISVAAADGAVSGKILFVKSSGQFYDAVASPPSSGWEAHIIGFQCFTISSVIYTMIRPQFWGFEVNPADTDSVIANKFISNELAYGWSNRLLKTEFVQIWTHLNVPATANSYCGLDGMPGGVVDSGNIVLPYAGGFRSISARVNSSISSGTLDVVGRKNGSSLSATKVTLNSGASSAVKVMSPPTETFAAGDRFGVWASSSSLSPTSLDLTVSVGFQFS